MKRWLRTIMGFSRAESNGFVILLPLVAIIVFSEPFTKWFVTRQSDDFSKENRVLDSLVKLMPKKEVKRAPDQTENFEKTKGLTTFDPNIASAQMLAQVGFSSTTASRILRYRSKGGKFKIKSDLMKIYGMDSALYKNLYAFILLPEKIENERNKINPRKSTFGDRKVVEKFDLNKADTIQLKTIYGIGPTLANRIVKYRSRLGGFVSTDQLREVYGLDSVVIHNLVKVSFLETGFQTSKININTLSEKEFQAHPYITRSVAKAIVAYRFQHGNFKDVEEIRNLFGIKPEAANKLIPYLKVSD